MYIKVIFTAVFLSNKVRTKTTTNYAKVFLMSYVKKIGYKFFGLLELLLFC